MRKERQDFYKMLHLKIQISEFDLKQTISKAEY